MSEINLPYWNTRKDMSDMNIPFSKPAKNMGNLNTAYDNIGTNDITEKKSNACPNMVLAMAYVPDQVWETPYEVTEGIHRGTLFPQLDKPFLGGGNKK